MALLPADDEEYTVETREASPAHVLIKIESFSMLSKHQIGKLESTEFEAGDYKWKVIINVDDEDGHICVYLCMVGTSSLPAGWEVNAIFTFFLYNHISANYHCFRGKARRFHAVDAKWGFSKLITKKSFTEACNGYLLEDKCVFGAEVFVIRKKPAIENVCVLDLSNPYKHKWEISKSSKLKSFGKSQEFCVGGYKWNIMVHPNGDARRFRRYVSMFLNWIDSKSSARGKNKKGIKQETSTEYTLETRDTSPTHLLTTIESFSLLPKHHIRIFESTEFEAGDYKWKVRMNLDEGGHVSVYLCMVGASSLPGWEVNAIFTFFLYNHISDNYLCFRGKAWRFHAIKSEWGFSKLMTEKSLREACNGYIFKDKCAFGAEVFVIKKQPLIENVRVVKLSDPYKREWKISGFSRLGSIWESEEFSTGEYKWKVMIYPNGDATTCGRYVSIFLNCVDAKSFGDGKKVNAACLFCFRNKLFNKKDHSMKVSHWFTSLHPSWGYADFKAIGDMRDRLIGFVVDDCCNLEIQLSVQALQQAALAL